MRVDDDGHKHGMVVFPDGDAFEMKLPDCRMDAIDERTHRVVVDDRGAFMVIDGQRAALLRLDGETMTLFAWTGDTSRRATAARSTECRMPTTKPALPAPGARPKAFDDEDTPPVPLAK